jgi:S-adenosylmethionine-diacylglycerol 3-amino-3-carboxypropyl transferase
MTIQNQQRPTPSAAVPSLPECCSEAGAPERRPESRAQTAPEPDAIPWAKFSERISYSSCNEDSTSELKALQLDAGKRVLCITAGGGRVLNLVHDRPSEIVAVDVNPTQNHLLELKVAAMRALDYEPYLAFLGVRKARDRLDVYQGFCSSLSTGARAYFDAHPEMVRRGVLFQGSLERFLVHVARISHIVRPFWIKRLFRFDDVAEQRRFLEGWDTRMWRFVGEAFCRRSILELFSRDPGFWRFVPPEVPLHRRIFDLMHRYLCNHLARDSHLLQLVFFARYIYEPAMPIYLRPEPFARIREALKTTRITPMTAPITAVLGSAADGSFDAYSIADVSSYLSETDFGTLMDEVMRTARPGARICSRGIFVHRPLATDHASRIRRDHNLERRLAFDDLAMVHEFVVGALHG